MSQDLKKYGINAVTMHDKAHEQFRQLSQQEKADFQAKLVNTYNVNLELAKFSVIHYLILSNI